MASQLICTVGLIEVQRNAETLLIDFGRQLALKINPGRTKGLEGTIAYFSELPSD